jgi:hypothetical protein
MVCFRRVGMCLRQSIVYWSLYDTGTPGLASHVTMEFGKTECRGETCTCSCKSTTIALAFSMNVSKES